MSSCVKKLQQAVESFTESSDFQIKRRKREADLGARGKTFETYWTYVETVFTEVQQRAAPVFAVLLEGAEGGA